MENKNKMKLKGEIWKKGNMEYHKFTENEDELIEEFVNVIIILQK